MRQIRAEESQTPRELTHKVRIGGAHTGTKHIQNRLGMRDSNSAPALRPPAEVAAEMRRKKGRGEWNGKTVDADAPVPSPVDMAATISKSLPLRRVAVRRRVMSGAASLSNGHYGHVGIGIKIGKEGGQHFVASVPSPLFHKLLLSPHASVEAPRFL